MYPKKQKKGAMRKTAAIIQLIGKTLRTATSGSLFAMDIK